MYALFISTLSVTADIVLHPASTNLLPFSRLRVKGIARTIVSLFLYVGSSSHSTAVARDKVVSLAMASNNIPLLAHLSRHAHNRFLDAFEIVSDPKLYTFEPQTLEDGLTVDMVCIGMHTIHDNTRRRKVLWARLAGESARYYYQQGYQFLELESGGITLYPDEGKVRHKDNPAPFNLVAPGRWSSCKDTKHAARKPTRTALGRLIKFAFILTSRTRLMGHQSQADLLKELEELCKNLQCMKNSQGKPESRGVVDDEEETAQFVGAQPPVMGRKYSMFTQSSSKRPAESMDGASVDHGVRSKFVNPTASMQYPSEFVTRYTQALNRHEHLTAPLRCC